MRRNQSCRGECLNWPAGGGKKLPGCGMNRKSFPQGGIRGREQPRAQKRWVQKGMSGPECSKKFDITGM